MKPAAARGYCGCPATNPSTDQFSNIWGEDFEVDCGYLAMDPRPRFGDDRWHLGQLQITPNNDRVSLNFSRINGARKRIAKEIIALQLGGRIVTTDHALHGVRRRRPTAYVTQLRALERLFDFMDQQGVAELCDIDQDFMDRYLAYITSTNVGAMEQSKLLGALVRAWECREFLTGGGINVRPFGGQPLLQIVDYKKPEENLTERIPEPVASGILNWATTYINEFSREIISNLRSVRALEAEYDKDRGVCDVDDVVREINEWLTRRVQLPGRRRRGRLESDYREISRRLGCHRSASPVNNSEAIDMLSDFRF